MSANDEQIRKDQAMMDSDTIHDRAQRIVARHISGEAPLSLDQAIIMAILYYYHTNWGVGVPMEDMEEIFNVVKASAMVQMVVDAVGVLPAAA
jgi:hypothetical protein